MRRYQIFQGPWSVFFVRLRRLSGQTETLGAIGSVKDGEVLLEEDGTQDLLAGTGTALQRTEAQVVVQLGVLHGGGGDGGNKVVGDGDAEFGQSRGARVDVTAVAVVQFGTGDGGVVGGDDFVVHKQERCARVGDGGAASLAVVGLAIDAGKRRLELPVTLRLVDGGVGDFAGVLGRVDGAELIGSGGILVEVGSEDGAAELGLDVFEPGLLAFGLNTVDGAETETEKSVAVGVVNEGAGDLFGEFDGLLLDGDTADFDMIIADRSRSTGAITVADGPRSAGKFGPGGGLGGIEDRMALDLVCTQLGAEHPPMVPN